MKSLIRKFLIVLIIGVLIFSGYKIYDSRTAPVQPDRVIRYDSMGPAIPGNAPILGVEVDTFEEAQAQTTYHIPLQEGIAIQQVWLQGAPSWAASPETPTMRSVAIQFENDILLIIRRQNVQPDWGKLARQFKYVKKVSVNGVPGMGADPGVEIYGDEAFFRQGNVSWWVERLTYTLLTDTLSLEELLKVAEVLH